MLVILSPEVDFTNVLHVSFVFEDGKSIKNRDDLTVFFMLSGSMSVKALPKTLMQLTLDRHRVLRPIHCECEFLME